MNYRHPQLGRKVVEAVAAHRFSLTPPPEDDTPAPARAPNTVAAQRARHNHDVVHALLQQGVALRVIARQLPNAVSPRLVSGTSETSRGLTDAVIDAPA